MSKKIESHAEPLSFADLVTRYGETEAMRTLETIEAVVSIQQLCTKPERRLQRAMQALLATDFAA